MWLIHFFYAPPNSRCHQPLRCGCVVGVNWAITADNWLMWAWLASRCLRRSVITSSLSAKRSRNASFSTCRRSIATCVLVSTSGCSSPLACCPLVCPLLWTGAYTRNNSTGWITHSPCISFSALILPVLIALIRPDLLRPTASAACTAVKVIVYLSMDSIDWGGLGWTSVHFSMY